MELHRDLVDREIALLQIQNAQSDRVALEEERLFTVEERLRAADERKKSERTRIETEQLRRSFEKEEKGKFGSPRYGG